MDNPNYRAPLTASAAAMPLQCAVSELAERTARLNETLFIARVLCFMVENEDASAVQIEVARKRLNQELIFWVADQQIYWMLHRIIEKAFPGPD